MPTNETFTQWLLKEINSRGLSYTQVAKKGGISHARISQVIGGEPPGKRFCIGISRALGVSRDEVFRRAGILPPGTPQNDQEQSALHLFRRLETEDKDRLLAIMRGLIARAERDEGER